MATLVREARDPWWTNLAVNVLGGLWNDYQQREQNKKLHALEGEIASAISGLSGGQDTDTNGGLMGNAGSNFGASLGSAGGNIAGGNGWENAFHQSDNPLAEYDANMAGIAPTAQAQGQATPMQATAQAAPVATITRRQPTAQEILNAFAGLMSSKRFSGVNPKAAQDLLTPYLTANENARAEQRRKELAEAYASAENDAAKLDVLYGGGIEGYVPQSILTSGQGRYQFDNPNLLSYTQNTGRETRYGSYNPRTGQFTEAGHFTNELTPQQKAENARAAATLEENRRQYNETLEYNREGRDITQRNLDRTYEADQRSIQSITRGEDGYQYIVRKNGERERFDPNSVALSEIEDSQIKTLTKRREGLVKQLEQLENRRKEVLKNSSGGVAEQFKGEDGKETGNPLLKEIDDEMAGIMAQIEQCDNDVNKIYERKLKQTEQATTQGHGTQTSQNVPKLGVGTSIASNMVSHANNGEIRSAFGAARPNGRSHRGVDIAVGKGTPILVPDTGCVLTVKSVGKNPRHSYGNHVALSGELTDKDGKKHSIEILAAHIDNGSISLKPGQRVVAGVVLGKVGNTGNTSDRSKPIKDKNGRVTGYQITNWYEGKGSGYHLHLETKIDGKHVDPEKFNELISPYIARQQSGEAKYTTTPNTKPNKTANEVITDQQRHDNTVVMRNPRTGKTITQRELTDMYQEADEGKLKEVGSSKAVDSYLMSLGYKYVGGGTSQSSSADVPVNVNATVSADVPNTSPNMTILGSGDIAQVSPDMTISGSRDMVATSPDQSPTPTYAEAVNHATSADIQQGLASLNGDMGSSGYMLSADGNPFWAMANLGYTPWDYAIQGIKPYRYNSLVG